VGAMKKKKSILSLGGIAQGRKIEGIEREYAKKKVAAKIAAAGNELEMAVIKTIVTAETLERKIYRIRGFKVIIDNDLAELYGVTTKRLNEQVRRNANRFPKDFIFQLSPNEFESLRSHFATLKQGRGQHRKYMPYAFTEHGALMVASVLDTPRAVEVSIYVVRAFVKLREMIASHKDLARRLDEMEKKCDTQFSVVFDAIRELMIPPEEDKRKIGFQIKGNRANYITSH
jgi:phage regulator Rha-like protein